MQRSESLSPRVGGEKPSTSASGRFSGGFATPVTPKTPVNSTVGLGIKDLTIVSIMPGSSADICQKFAIGDLISHIDGQIVTGQDVASKIMGPVGSTVEITVKKRDGASVVVPLLRKRNWEKQQIDDVIGKMQSSLTGTQSDAEMHEHIESMAKRASKMQAEMQKLQGNYEEEKGRRIELEALLSETRAKYSTEVSHLKSDLADAKNSLNLANAELAKLRQAASSNGSESEERGIKLHSALTELKKVKDDLAHARRELDGFQAASKQERSSLELMLQADRAEKERLKLALTEMESKGRRDLENAATRAAADRKQIDDRLKMEKSERERLVIELDKMRKQIEKAHEDSKKAALAVQNENTNLKKQLAEATAQIEQTRLQAGKEKEGLSKTLQQELAERMTLQKKIEVEDREIFLLRKQLEDANRVANDMRAATDQAKGRLSADVQERDRLLADTAAVKRALEECQRNLANANADKFVLEERMSVEKSERERTAKELAAVEKNLVEAMQTASGDHENLMRKLETQKDIEHNLTLELRRAEKALTALQDSSQRELNDLKRRFQGEQEGRTMQQQALAVCESELGNVRRALEEANRVLMETRRELDESRISANSEMREKQRLEMQLLEIRAEHKANTEELKRQLEESRRDFERLDQEAKHTTKIVSGAKSALEREREQMLRQLEDLESERRSLNTTISDLSKELAISRHTAATATKSAESATKMEETAKQRIFTIETERDTLHAQVLEWKEKAESLSTQTALVQTERSRLLESIANKEEVARRLKSDVTAMEEVMMLAEKNSAEQLSQLERQLAATQEDLTTTTASLSDAQKGLARLQRQLDDSVRCSIEANSQHSDLQNQLDALHSHSLDRDKQLSALQMSIAVLKDALTVTDKRAFEAESQLSRLNVQLATRDTQLAEAKNQIEELMRDLQAAIQEGDRVRQSFSKTESVLTQRKGQIEEEHTTLQIKYNTLVDQLNNREAMMSTMERSMTSLVSEVVSLKEKLEDEKGTAGKLTDLVHQLKNLRRERDALLETLQAREAENTRLSQELRTSTHSQTSSVTLLQDQLHSLESEMERLRRSLANKEEEVSVKDEIVVLQRQQLRDAENQHASLSDHLADALAKIRLLESTAEETQRQLISVRDSLTFEKESAEKKMESAAKEKAQILEQLAKTKEGKREIKKREGVLEEELSIAKNNSHTLQRMLDQASADLARVRETLGNRDQTLGTLETRERIYREHVEATIGTLEGELEVARAELKLREEETSSTKERLESRVKLLEKEVAELRLVCETERVVNQQRISQLENALKSEEADRANESSQLLAAKSAVVRLQQHVAALNDHMNRQNADLQVTVEAVRSEKRELSTRLEVVTRQLEQVTSLTSEQVKREQLVNAQLTEKITSLQHSIRSSNDALTIEKEKNSSLDRQILELQHTLFQIQLDRDQHLFNTENTLMNLEVLNAKCSEYATRIEQLEPEAARCRVLGAQVELLRGELDILDATLAVDNISGAKRNSAKASDWWLEILIGRLQRELSTLTATGSLLSQSDTALDEELQLLFQAQHSISERVTFICSDKRPVPWWSWQHLYEISLSSLDNRQSARHTLPSSVTPSWILSPDFPAEDLSQDLKPHKEWSDLNGRLASHTAQEVEALLSQDGPANHKWKTRLSWSHSAPADNNRPTTFA